MYARCPCYCLNLTIANLGLLLTDLLLAFAPIRLIWSTNLDRASKIRYTALFSSVLVCTILGGLRSYAILYGSPLLQFVSFMTEVVLIMLAMNVTVFAALVFRIGIEDASVSSEGRFSSVVDDKSFAEAASMGTPDTGSEMTHTDGSLETELS